MTTITTGNDGNGTVLHRITYDRSRCAMNALLVPHNTSQKAIHNSY